MTALLLVLLIGQTRDPRVQVADPYLLIGNTPVGHAQHGRRGVSPNERLPSPPAAVLPTRNTESIHEPMTPTPEPAPVITEPVWGWYKLRHRPNWIKTSWVWGYKDPADHSIKWQPDDQVAAWEKAGKQMPVWTGKDHTGQQWEYWHADVLADHLLQLNTRQEQSITQARSVPQARSALPGRTIGSAIISGAPPSRSQQPVYTQPAYQQPLYPAGNWSGGLFGGSLRGGVLNCFGSS